MRYRTTELLRFGRDKGILRQDDRYLRVAGDALVQQVEMPLDHDDFLDLVQKLRYHADVEDDDRADALAALASHVTAILGTDAWRLEQPTQCDLVMSAAELSALPFELALGPDRKPLFIHEQPRVVITRRVRQELVEHAVRWPARPRVLFAVASPSAAGPKVPFEEHLAGLRKALAPWIEPLRGFEQAIPDERTVLRVLKETSLEKLKSECASDPGFTHVHLLAHGTTVGEDHRKHFGIALHKQEGSGVHAVTAEDLVAALTPLKNSCVSVTLAACDGGNQTNTIIPDRSLAHEFHRAGFPIVLASQFPLTFKGSAVMTERFYGAVFAGKDVRDGLHDARVALHGIQEQAGHDWASLVGYVQLPEGYADHLTSVRLEAELASLKTAQRWSDHLTQHDIRNDDAYRRVAERLRERLGSLERTLEQSSRDSKKGILEENLGLLGSAEKRLAQLYFEWSRFHPEPEPKRAEMRKALERSTDWYRRAFAANQSHHWSAVQLLSLEAVRTGKIVEWQWCAALAAAETDRKQEGEYWAQGSSAELFLLAPLAGQGDRTQEAADALREMKQRVAEADAGDFPIDSTRRQLQRYATWWTKDNQFFEGQPADLAAAANELLGVLG